MMWTASTALRPAARWDAPRHGTLAGRIMSLVALAALATWIAAPLPPVLATSVDPLNEEQAGSPSPAQSGRGAAGLRREVLVGGYGGVSLTLPSIVKVVNPGRTDMTMEGFDWIGRPFKSPIYYGLRAQAWSPGSLIGGMVDFTHAKAIAEPDSIGTLTGVQNGQPVPAKAPVRDVFRHLEFSHGHNMVTLNGLIGMPSWLLPIRPYVGLGAGVSLPHTEVGFKNENQRTYEYQFAGFAGQVVVGVRIPLGRLSAFVEYKFTYAPYSVPLSHEPTGWLLVTDLWRQARAWYRGEAPPGGILSTTLMTHHGIAGLLVRTSGGS